MEENKSMEVFAKSPIRKAVLQNALPAMAAMLMVLIYNLADTFFIGQTHDDLQVAAVSLATPVFLLFMSVGTVFGIGGTSVISRALGEGRRDYAKKVCSFCMWCCVGVGVLMSVLFLVFMDQILAMIGASAETWDYAKTYLTIVSCSGPFVLIASCYSNVIRAEGQSGKAMMGQLLGNLLNVILDPIMILVFGWNIAGAAIATVIGNVVGAGYYIVYFLKGSSSLSISLKDFSVKEKVASGVLAINDDRHGLYRTWTGRSAAARLLCRCEKLGALQKRPQILADICLFSQHRADADLLPLYRTDRQCVPHGCCGV